MRILVVGAGPAGLLFRHLAGQNRPKTNIVTIDRRDADSNVGWGITLPVDAVEFLRRNGIQLETTVISKMRVTHNGELVKTFPLSSHAVSRQALLSSLLGPQRDLPPVLFRTELDRMATSEFDLIVAADGANSMIRSSLAAELGTRLQPAPAHHLWLGAKIEERSMRVMVNEVSGGIIVSWLYPYAQDMCTLVVQCSDAVWRKTGFDSMPMSSACVELSRILRSDLNGVAPMARDDSKWVQFQHVTNRASYFGNTALIGDALHTTHFSIGIGTTLAFEDAAVLARSIHATKLPREALHSFHRKRRASIKHYQAEANLNMQWFDHLPIVHSQGGREAVARKLNAGIRLPLRYLIRRWMLPTLASS